MLVVGASVVGLLVIGSVGYALQPVETDGAVHELHSPARRVLPEVVRTLPTDYAKAETPVRRLGPPLPGDLGAALAEDEDALVSYRNPFRYDPAVRTPPPASRAYRASGSLPAESKLAEVRTSGLFFVNRRGEEASLDALPLPNTGPFDLAIAAGNRGDARPSSQASLSDLALLRAGTLIPATLVTGLNSDLPGHVIAQVSEPVFDSETGRQLLVPQGSRLVGRYDSDVRFGQSRAFVVWQSMTRPDGSTIDLRGAGAVDGAGFAGLSDKVDRHTGRLVGAALLSSVLSVGTELGRSDEDRLLDALADGGQRTLGRAGDAVVQRQLDVAPTITVRPGARFNVLVATDIPLAPYGDAP